MEFMVRVQFGIWQLLTVYVEVLLEEAGVATVEEYLLRVEATSHDDIVRISERAEAAAWEAYDQIPVSFRAPVTPDALRRAVANIFESAAWVWADVESLSNCV